MPSSYELSLDLLQLTINAEQKLEIDRLKRELDSTRAELSRANSVLQSKEMVGIFLLPHLPGVHKLAEAIECIFIDV